MHLGELIDVLELASVVVQQWWPLDLQPRNAGLLSVVRRRCFGWLSRSEGEFLMKKGYHRHLRLISLLKCVGGSLNLRRRPNFLKRNVNFCIPLDIHSSIENYFQNRHSLDNDKSNKRLIEVHNTNEGFFKKIFFPLC